MNDDDIIKQLLPLFRDSAGSAVLQANRTLLLLEASELPDSVRTDSTNELLRILHTLKGDSGSVGLDEVVTLSHEIESSMKAVKTEKGIPPGLPVYGTWFAALDKLAEIATQEYDRERVQKEIEEIKERLAGSGGDVADRGEAPSAAERKSGEGPPSKTPAEESGRERFRREAPERGDEVVRVSFRRLTGLTESMSELLSARILSEQRLHDLQEDARELLSRHQEWSKTGQRFMNSMSRSYRQGFMDKEAFQELKEKYKEMDAAGQAIKRTGQGMLGSLQTAHKQVRHTGTVMRTQEENLRGLQMTPVADLFASFHRWVRDAALELGKKIEFKTEGESVELDRSIVQRLREPLIHLLRNALDHGVETPEERLAAGKSERGLVALRAFAAGGGVVIEVEDDGRGLDTEVIGRVAVQRGMVGEAEARNMSERAVQSLAFQPGFSTRGKVSKMSGRGVGLDVVTAWVEDLRGRVEWDSSPGKGLLIRLRLPLTMATIQALITRVGGQKFAIPHSAVDRVLRVKTKSLTTVEGRTSIIHEGQPVELIPLAGLLDMAPSEDEHPAEMAVVISYGARGPKGWIVDDLLGEQEIVMKDFTRFFKKVKNMAGAAIIGSGEIVMVLNAADLHQRSSGLRMDPAGRSGKDRKAGAAKKVLVVDDSLITRTMEQRILGKAGYEVDGARDGKDALERMDKNDYDLVVSDMQMPRMDGAELTRNLRKDPRYAETPVIIVSFLDSEEDKMRGMEAGASAYLTKKQFNQARLLELVQRLIGG